MPLASLDLLELLGTAAAVVVLSLAMQSVLLWRWERRLTAGRYSAPIQRAVRASLPDVTQDLAVQLEAATPAVVDAAAQRALQHLPGVIEVMVTELGRQLTSAVLGHLGGKASGEARVTAKQDGQIAAALAGDADPIVGAILDLSPRLRKLVERNPDLVEALKSRVLVTSAGNGNQQQQQRRQGD